ncbi:MAG: hypothetical protein H7A53_04115 [Akkermansiaceae bacterium]|nr:hypothetical protein [Akkermansiaceae bacterium]MCP5550059.1 hypothetical protein [Akkermansiaceae bacterium]
MPAFPKRFGFVVSVGSRLVQRVFRLAKKPVLRGYKFPRILRKPRTRIGHLSLFSLFRGLGFLDPLQFPDPGALQESLSGFGVNRLGREAILNFEGIRKNSAKYRILQQLRIDLRFVGHVGNIPPSPLAGKTARRFVQQG